MENIDFDKLFKKHNSLIDSYKKKYGAKQGYDDYKQKLMISLWIYIRDNYNSDYDLDTFFCSTIKYLAVRAAYDHYRNRQLSFEESFCLIDDCNQDELLKIEDSDILRVIEENLSDKEKKIVYSLDLYSVGDKIVYKKIAKKLGMSERMFYYYIGKIRRVLTKKLNYKPK